VAAEEVPLANADHVQQGVVYLALITHHETPVEARDTVAAAAVAAIRAASRPGSIR
jgi:hypothetical protein